MDAHLLRRASDRTAPSYDDRFAGLQRPKYEAVLRVLSEHDWAPDPQGGSWLDAGCGTGLLADHIGPCGVMWTGVDLSCGMLERARRRGVWPVQGDLDALPLAAGAFHAAFCFTALVDRRSASPALTELARVVRPSGLIVVTMLPHDVPADLEDVARASGLVAHASGTGSAGLSCGQDRAFFWRREMLST